MRVRENHSYKYGYGKLFHSGYHFVDLLTMMLSWEKLPLNKQPSSYQLMSSHFSPYDQLFSMDQQFYQKLFPEKSYVTEYNDWKEGRFQQFGELDLSTLIQFYRDNCMLSSCTLNLLHSGFSKRAWHKQAADTYKGNGRVRHETMILSMGPLLSVQVHSYQGCEVKERFNENYNHDEVGGLEHFDIHLFRNSDLIGGKPWEVIQGKDFFPQELVNNPSFIEYNEEARYTCLYNFLKGKETNSTLIDHNLTIDLVTSLYSTISTKRNNQLPFIERPVSDSMQKIEPLFSNYKTTQKKRLAYVST